MDDSTENAITLERAGQWSSAADAYRDQFWHSVAQGQVTEMIGSLHNEARMYQRQERYEEAGELAELCHEMAQRNAIPHLAARAINTQAVILHCQRDLDGAWSLYQTALDLAFDLGDDALISWTCLNMGVVANIRGDLHQARHLYLESTGASLRSADKGAAMMAYNNLGMMCADLREWMEAEVNFDRGIELAEQLGDRAFLAKLYANRAEPLIHGGELTAAWASLDRAESIASWTGEREIQAVIARFRGRIARLEGNRHAADQHLEHALNLATEADLALDRAEVLEEISRLRREQDRPDEACAAAKEALSGFGALGAERDVARVETLLREWGG